MPIGYLEEQLYVVQELSDHIENNDPYYVALVKLLGMR